MFQPALTSFVCAADSGSFNKAAEKLFLSSTAVTKQIDSLEKHLDMRLFVRTKHGVTLTPAGRVIYKRAKEMFACSEQAIAEARRAMGAEQATFRVGTSILNPCKPFMDLWYEVNSQFPNFRLQIVPFEDDHSDILTEISSLGEKFDFLIGACDSRLWMDRCRFQPLGTYRHCVAVPREHPLAKKHRLTLQDLEGETVMLGKRGDSDSVDRIRETLSTRPNIRLEDTPHFYDMEVFNRCVQTRRLLLTLECWEEVHPSLVTIPVEWEYRIPYGILYQLRPGREICQFLDAVRERMAGREEAAPAGHSDQPL